jgi:F-type H+-transporting ATPase subunit a
MAGEGHAAGAAEEKLDAIQHILDQTYLEIPVYHSHHFFDGKLPLPSLHIFGLDLSITRHVVMMWVAGALLVVLLSAAFRRPRLIPSGLANFFEAIVVFVRNDIVLENLGERGKPFLPFLLTLFFFILFCNLLGLVPYSATATANLAVTAGLAICSFAAIQITGIANNGFLGYLKSIVPPGLPTWLLPIMIPVELIGMFVKPFALCIRLFANMTAGHVIILSLFSLIFTFQSLLVAPVSVAFASAVYFLEIFVALIQAFIFTLLSTFFIGMAAHPEH